MIKYHLVKAALASAIVLSTTTLYSKEIRGWNVHVPDYPVSKAMDKFGELVAERTEGRITPKTYHSAQLGTQDEAIQQIQFDGIDFAVFNFIPLNNIVPETKATTLPYVFRSLDHMHRVMDGAIGDEIGKAMEEYNMVALAWYDGGVRSFYARVPLNSIEDFKGVKFRVQSSDMNVAMVEALGGNATPIPYGEVYTSIQSGVVDGAENNWPSYQSSGHYEVAKNYMVDGHAIVPEVFAMNKTVWDGLTDTDKEIVRQAARESATLQRQLWQERAKKSEDIVRAAGVTIVEITDKTPFIEAMKPVYERFADTDILKSLVKRIQETE